MIRLKRRQWLGVILLLGQSLVVCTFWPAMAWDLEYIHDLALSSYPAHSMLCRDCICMLCWDFICMYCENAVSLGWGVKQTCFSISSCLRLLVHNEFMITCNDCIAACEMFSQFCVQLVIITEILFCGCGLYVGWSVCLCRLHPMHTSRMIWPLTVWIQWKLWWHLKKSLALRSQITKQTRLVLSIWLLIL